VDGCESTPQALLQIDQLYPLNLLDLVLPLYKRNFVFLVLTKILKNLSCEKAGTVSAMNADSVSNLASSRGLTRSCV
jgi:hypothetical protein